MKKSRFDSDFLVFENKYGVKLHKSGKNWIKTILALFGLARLFKGGKAEEQMYQDTKDFVCPENRLLKELIGAGPLFGGLAVGGTRDKLRKLMRIYQ